MHTVIVYAQPCPQTTLPHRASSSPSYLTLLYPTPPNTSLNYHYHNQSHCIIQDYIRSPASMNQSSYFCYNSLLAVNTCRLMFIIQSNGLIWCRKANFDCRDICKKNAKPNCKPILFFSNISARGGPFLKPILHWNHGIETFVLSTIKGPKRVLFQKNFPRASKIASKTKNCGKTWPDWEKRLFI